MNSGSLHSRFGRVTLVVTLLAVLLQAAIPAGFMPGTGAASPGMQFCPGHTLAGTPDSPGDDQPANETGRPGLCSYAVSGVANGPLYHVRFFATAIPDPLPQFIPAARRVPVIVSRAHAPRGPPRVVALT